MPLQNRVTPEGSIIADAARGLLMGNRGGCLHGPDRTLGRRRWASMQWICCRLDFNGRRRQVMAPGRYTELFFLDEATALAAGHRPCFECRRQDAMRFAELWAAAHDPARSRATAGEIDRALHAERLAAGGGKRTYSARLADLPDGAFVRGPSGPRLVAGGTLIDWSPAGYRERHSPVPDRSVEVLTPPGIIAVLAAGYVPVLHDTASD